MWVKSKREPHVAPARIPLSGRPVSPGVQPTRFVPIRRHRLLPLLLQDRGDDDGFEATAGLLHHVMLADADQKCQTLDASYDPFDPDPLVPSPDGGDADADTETDAFLATVDDVMEQANFRRIGDPELHEAFEERSLFPLSVQVDPDAYDVLRLYRRGVAEKEEKVRGWKTLWRWQTRRLQLYERLVVVMRLRDEVLATDHTARTADMEAGRIYLKLFKNIPKADIEMVLPDTRLRLRRMDRFMVGGPLVAGIGWTLFQSFSVLAALAAGGFALTTDDPRLRATGGVLLVLAGYLWRTMSKIKTTRLQYLQTLSQGLYFRNLANNRAVLEQVLKFAKDEEEKEALLAYHFLTRDGPMTGDELDRRAEAWLQERTGRSTDFDVGDGLDTLDAMDLVDQDGDQWVAVEPREGAERLDAVWNRRFGATPA